MTAVKLLIAGLLVALPAAAQTTEATRLPGDEAPPALSVMLRPPSGRPLPPPDTTPAVPQSLASEAAEAALSTCAAQGLRVGIALTDTAGYLRVGLATDGAGPGTIYGAVRKDLSVIEFRQPTSIIQDHLRADASLAARVRPNMEVRPGAVPIVGPHGLLGALGVDGATAQQDEACASAGVAKIRARLN